MKTLLVLYNDSDWKHEFPYNSDIYNNEELRQSYESFAKTAKKEGLLFARASYKWYKGKGLFSKAWVYEGGWKKVKNLKADVVFDKTPYETKFMKIKDILKKELRIFNDPYIDRLCSDKSLTYEIYKELMPRLFVVNNKKELKLKLEKIRTDKVVLKPVSGSSAKDVILFNKDELPKRVPKNTIVQEFIDTSKGIPKFTKTVSDFRVIVCDGKIITAVIRIAKSGWISNISRGGDVVFVPVNKIPEDIVKLTNQIDSKLKKYKSRLYTADFVVDSTGKPLLMEMNSKPGFFFFISRGRKDIAEKFENAVLKSIKLLIS